MARLVVLEDFTRSAAADAMPGIDNARLEAETLEAFDRGYAAGWDDASRAAEQDSAQALNALRLKLQDLSFTYHEARAHVMQSLAPLLEAISHHAVPEILRETLGARVVSILDDLATGSDGGEAELLVAPGEAAGVEAAIDGLVVFPVTIVEEDLLSPGQIQLRLGAAEVAVDLDEMRRTLNEALDALSTLNKDMLSHG
ncbi:hypothetical protein E2L08_12160 [Palleronia sediminis]|uniref:Uncharacterized protein n=1 Tax=Palleronia sediminis TaxID=2547833 RepID=A0A4R6A3T3_9RHOB|nr:hypothetical protein [Palleronia sediminis]TDL78240.1 hypothetical protein E2L08_12160 [Palleronia sediminis]